jgi:hypothetical protein
MGGDNPKTEADHIHPVGTPKGSRDSRGQSAPAPGEERGEREWGVRLQRQLSRLTNDIIIFFMYTSNLACLLTSLIFIYDSLVNHGYRYKHFIALSFFEMNFYNIKKHKNSRKTRKNSQP